MNDLEDGLYGEIRELAALLEGSTARGTAAVFGVCGRALAPLLRQAGQRDGGSWAVPDFDVALDLIEAFATGVAEAADHGELRERLPDIGPGEHPWSTYAQDALICADAGLAAASPGGRPKPVLIEYALEPLMAVAEDRDANVIRVRGHEYWSREVLKDPVMAQAVQFLRGLIGSLSQAASVDSREYARLVGEAEVLRPVHYL